MTITQYGFIVINWKINNLRKSRFFFPLTRQDVEIKLRLDPSRKIISWHVLD